jgi:flavin-dependent dehydrogenase
MRELLEPATFIEGSIAFRPDYSYYSTIVTGDNFYCIGDAGAFVDPIFSQGVIAAMYNAVLCSWGIASSLRHEERRRIYSKIVEKQIMTYYGFSRVLALGHFGQDGVEEEAVKGMMRSFPRSELELTMAAAMTTNRSENLRRMAREAGMLDDLTETFGLDKLTVLDQVMV